MGQKVNNKLYFTITMRDFSPVHSRVIACYDYATLVTEYSKNVECNISQTVFVLGNVYLLSKIIPRGGQIM